MITIPHPELPTLSAAMALTGPRGMCFYRSIALCLDIPDSFLVIGTIRAATKEELRENPDRSKVRFFHAWVESDGILLSPTTIETAGGMPLMRPSDYYEVNKVRDIRAIPHSIIDNLANGLIRANLLHGFPLPAGYLVNRLFETAGLKYQISEQGGVIPL